MPVDFVPSFPDAIWDGLTGNNDRVNIHTIQDPDWEDWNRIVREVIQTQTKLFPKDKVVSLVEAAPVSIDVSLGEIFNLELTDSRTLGTPTNPTDGKRMTLRVVVPAGSNRTLTLPAVFRFGDEITAITETVAATTDYIGAIYNGNDARWDVVAYVKGY
jgi:hypothetical protein